MGVVGQDEHRLEGNKRGLEKRLVAAKTRQVMQRDATGRRLSLQSSERPDIRGEDVSLTLDMQVQFFAESAIARAVDEYKAKWGGVLVVDVPTGDILAWAQYPFFNPNVHKNYVQNQYRNRLALDALEPGSTFKPLVMAAALQENKIGANSGIKCENSSWRHSAIYIRDTQAYKNR